MQNAPVLISVYNRRMHLEQCVNSLKLNTKSKDTDLFIVSDGPNTIEETDSIEDVRRYIGSINGFKSVTPIIRENNLGGHDSSIQAITYLLKKYERLIFLEDDNIVSISFLDYMNSALQIYAEDLSIFSVSGYNYPVRMPDDYLFEVYKSRHFSAWGVGLWWNRWEKINWELPDAKTVAVESKQSSGLNSIGEHISALLLYSINNKKMAGDVLITYHQFKNDLYSVFPVVSRVRNLGHDGTGEHCLIDQTYTQQHLDTGSTCIFQKELYYDPKIAKILKRFFLIPRRTKVIWYIGRFIPSALKRQLNKLR